MTAAEAVETSVTTINSLSQDFTNINWYSWVQTIYFNNEVIQQIFQLQLEISS